MAKGKALFGLITVRTMAADRLPEMVRKFVGSSVQLTQVDTYATADAEGIRVVRTEITVGALPVSGSATQTLTPQGEATDVHVHCVVKANIPFVGKMVAEAAEPFIGKALSLQSQEAEAWLANR